MNILQRFADANSPRAVAVRCLLLIVILAACGGTPLAQNQRQRAAEDKKNRNALILIGKMWADDADKLQQTGTKESLTQAVEKYEKALEFFRRANELRSAAITLCSIGQSYEGLGEPRKALGYFEQALELARATDFREEVAAAQGWAGISYSEVGETQKALDYLQQALEFWRAAANRKEEANTLINIVGVYFILGDMGKALDYSTQALADARAAGDKMAEASALSDIGMVYSSTGEQQKALENYASALALSRAIGDRGGEAAVLNNMGGAYDELGEKQKALDNYTQAMEIRRAVGDRSGEANSLNNLGRLYDSQGEHQKALDNYGQALEIRRAIGHQEGIAVTLINIGGLYFTLGESEKSLDYFTQSLALARTLQDRNLEAITLNNIGLVNLDMGERQKALSYYEQSLPLLRAVKNRRTEATTLGNIGQVYSELGDKQKALDYQTQALQITRDIGDRSGEATTLDQLGRVYSDAGEQQKALESYTQSLALSRAVGDRGGEAAALYGVAYEERERGDLAEARARIEEAINIIESIRAKITSQRLRSSYFATVQQYYEFYIELLMRLHKQNPSGGFNGAALQAAERARARVLLETLMEAGANIRQGIDPNLAERERASQQRLNAAAERRLRLMSGAHTEAQARASAEEVAARTTELEQVESEIRQKSPRYAALTQPAPLSLREIQTEVLDPETLLLEYSLGEKGSYLWAVTSDSITSYELPKRTEIEETARQVYALLNNAEAWSQGTNGVQEQSSATTPQQSAAPPQQQQRGLSTGSSQAVSQAALQRLSQMILAPAAAQLGGKRLLVVADGALQFIPFSALPDPAAKVEAAIYQPLIVQHELINLPSASTLAILRREMKERTSATKTVAVLADPVFDGNDERLRGRVTKTAPSRTQSTPTRGLALVGENVKKAAQQTGALRERLYVPRLPGTRREAAQIVGLVPPAERKEALDFAASRETLTDAELGSYRYLHIATHGFLDSEQPELSGILLSMVNERGEPQDGFYRAHEVYNLKLSADMVVLSACETGLGKEIKGEGLVGLTRGFMYAGAPRVVVSLWSVNDAATAELMTRFYRSMLVDKVRPAQALQAAQVSMLGDKRFAAPFYWAAFTLQGEWR